MIEKDYYHLSAVPPEFDGSFHTFFSEHIERNLPSPESVLAIHNLLEDYLMDPNNRIFVTRHFKEFKRAGFPFHLDGGYTLFCGDNEPALWFYARARLSDYERRIPSIREAIASSSFPISIARDTRRSENIENWHNWRKETWESEQFSGQGWYHAHLFDAARSLDVSGLERRSFAIRMVRFLHPANHFPMPSHTGRKRRFVSRISNGSRDMSEGDGIKAFIFERYKERYAACFERFLKLAGADHELFTQQGGEPRLAYVEVPRVKDNARHQLA